MNKKIKEIRIKIKCCGCGKEKWVGKEQKEQPMCDTCFMPMLAKEARYG